MVGKTQMLKACLCVQGSVHAPNAPPEHWRRGVHFRRLQNMCAYTMLTLTGVHHLYVRVHASPVRLKRFPSWVLLPDLHKKRQYFILHTAGVNTLELCPFFLSEPVVWRFHSFATLAHGFACHFFSPFRYACLLTKKGQEVHFFFNNLGLQIGLTNKSSREKI